MPKVLKIININKKASSHLDTSDICVTHTHTHTHTDTHLAYNKITRARNILHFNLTDKSQNFFFEENKPLFVFFFGFNRKERKTPKSSFRTSAQSPSEALTASAENFLPCRRLRYRHWKNICAVGGSDNAIGIFFTSSEALIASSENFLPCQRLRQLHRKNIYAVGGSDKLVGKTFVPSEAPTASLKYDRKRILRYKSRCKSIKHTQTTEPLLRRGFWDSRGFESLNLRMKRGSREAEALEASRQRRIEKR